MVRECLKCRESFSISSKQLSLLERLSPKFSDPTANALKIPPPTLCPDCRKQRRLLFRNERVLYHRSCDLTSQRMLSIYPASVPFPVYEHSVWWGESWDPLHFGAPYDLSRSFFEQFAELRNRVPRINLYVDDRCENSKFCNQITMCKSCYLLFSASSSEDCYYGYRVNNSRNCLDCLMTNSSELCYDCVESFSCYSCRHSQKISQCTDCAFVYDCRNCKSCMFCYGLRNKEYCLFNEQLTKSEYQSRLAALRLDTLTGVNSARATFAAFCQRFPRRFATLRNVEDVTGDNIENAKSCVSVFDGENLEDVSYCQFFQDGKDCSDINFGCDRVELAYEVSTTGIDAREIAFCIDVWPVVSNLFYCDSCSNGTKYCFGCVGLRKQEYCILNRQYTAEQYHELLPKIVASMQSFGEWGEFFPGWLSPHGYNETVAMQYFPLSREAATASGYNWQKIEVHTYNPQSYIVPDSIREVADDLLQAVLACSSCAKNFKVIPHELEFYRKNSIPLPTTCSDCRQDERAGRRNPPKLFSRLCSECGSPIETTFAPSGSERASSERVCCEACYLKLL